MSYVVLARRWRPQTFEEVVGQEHITKTLSRAVQTKRIGHAYLFTGPRGIGKTSTARILAKALNCHKGLSNKPCTKCPSCNEVQEGNSIDVLEIDGASNRGIDEIRDLRANVKFAPARDRFKIYIIDEVHMLTPEAFNALLKTLEEPPQHVKFIFATTSPYKIPLTIVSRCQRFDFRIISSADIITRLKKILSMEKIQAQEDALFAIAGAASGSMRDAESILDQLISFSEGKIKAEDVESLLGLVDQDTFVQLGDAIIKKETLTAFKLLGEIINQGKDIEQFVNSWQKYWRDLLMLKIGSEEMVELPETTLKKLKKQSEKISNQRILWIVEVLSNTHELLRKSSFSRIPLEIAVAEIMDTKSGCEPSVDCPEEEKAKGEKKHLQRQNPHQPVTAHSSRNSVGLSEIHPKQNPAQPETAHSIPESHSSSNTLTLEEAVRKWDDVIERVKEEKLLASTLLKEGKPVKVTDRKIVVGFRQESMFQRDGCKRLQNKEIIEKAFHEVFKTKLVLECTGGILDDPVENNETQEKENPRRRSERKEDLSKEPLVKKVMDIFGVKVIEVKEKEP